MSRIFALPVMAVVLGLLACGASATKAPLASTLAPSTSGDAQVSTRTLSDTAAPTSEVNTAGGAVAAQASDSLPTPEVGATATLQTDSNSTAPANSSTPAGATAPESSPPATPVTAPNSPSAATPAKAVIIVGQPGIGIDVGSTVSHFEFTLIDGTRQSTAQLASQGRPVFLFFFATW